MEREKARERERERERERGWTGRERDWRRMGSMEGWIPPRRSSVTDKKRVKREGEKKRYRQRERKSRRVAESAVTRSFEKADEVRYSDYTYHGPHPLWRVELGLRDSHNLTFWLGKPAPRVWV
ncbi:hypothetical protein ASPFODRAFT_184733 [Aspergillus luchuensis CBS 106.47]|uniref:Uncharacterized protein n=1 Tax=Aspergillus luchuensis (strain CBS 106.47) TaxID=1137211 RepID=A0A1M3TNR8_ASPLC|nr:hypothetical protein ASPFODRAFT_184733 [Aspergillus luchuensis CBS 106.47]